MNSGWKTSAQSTINYFERDQGLSEKTLKRVVPTTPSVEQTSFEEQGVEKGSDGSRPGCKTNSVRPGKRLPVGRQEELSLHTGISLLRG